MYSQAPTHPLISIAMTSYNGARYLQAQLESIYAQTYPHIEVVVCDDGSTDETLQILKYYEAERGLRLYCNPQNLGYVQNFYKSASLCTGVYVAFSDQDDLWYPDKLAVLHHALGETALLAYSDTALIDGDGTPFCASRYQFITGVKQPETSKLDALRESYMIGCTMMIKTELLAMAAPFPPSHLAAHDNWLPFIAKTANRLVYVNQALMGYRVHDQNVSCKLRQKGLFPAIKKRFKQQNLPLFLKLRSFLYHVTNREMTEFKKMHPFLSQSQETMGS